MLFGSSKATGLRFSLAVIFLCYFSIPQQAEGQWITFQQGYRLSSAAAAAVKKDGNVLVAGVFQDSLFLNADTVYHPSAPSCCYGHAMYIAEYSPNGELLSSEVIADALPDSEFTEIEIGDLWVDEDGSYIVAGRLNSYSFSNLYTQFGSGEIVRVLSVPGNRVRTSGTTTFVARYDNQHNLLWANELETTIGQNFGRVTRIAADSDGGVYVTGSPLLTRLNKEGTIEWTFDPPEATRVWNVVSEQGEVCITARDSGFAAPLPDGENGVVIICLNREGQETRKAPIRTVADKTNWLRIYDLAYQKDGSFLVSGYARDNTLFVEGSTPITIQDIGGKTNTFLAQLDASLSTFKWAIHLPTVWRNGFWYGVPTLSQCDDGTFVVAGTFQGDWVIENTSIDFGSVTRPAGYVLAFQDSGDLLDGFSYSSAGGDLVTSSVQCLSGHQVMLAGNFTFEMDFDPEPTSELIKYSLGFDGFVLQTNFKDSPYPGIVEPESPKFEGGSLSIFPNPAKSAARINYTPPKTGHVDISMYDMRGRKISVLHQAQAVAYDQIQIRLGTQKLAAGTYIIVVTAEYGRTHRLLTVLN